MSSISHRSLKATGVNVAGACERQKQIPGFDQGKYGRSHVLCIGAGGLMSNIAPAVVRKGIGALTILDADDVEVSNLNRQRFYPLDIGQNKAIALVRNLQRECIHETRLTGYAIAIEDAIFSRQELSCDIVICGVDNDPARVAAARFFREHEIPIIFTAVSAQANHGYVFIQRAKGACIGCVFPDIGSNEVYPCPGTPAISDILQLLGSLVVYGIDSVLMGRKCDWNYRAIYLPTGKNDCALCVEKRTECAMKMKH